MNFVEKIIYMFQKEMETPKPYGWFHLMWIIFIIIALFLLNKMKHNEKNLRIILFTYGIIALILELLKQIVWSFNYDGINNTITWDYQWYAFPFQLCTTPIFVSLIYLIIKNNKIKKYLLSYLAFVTILGSFLTVIIPDSCFVDTILINIHTMWLHCGSLVVSIYLIMNNVVKLKKENLISAFKIFLIFLVIAEILNIGIYNSGILNGETFNMFYISPYFTSILPIFNAIQQNVPYILFLLIYIFSIFIGSIIVHLFFNFIKKN